MHTLEPLCNLEQSTLICKLGFREKVYNRFTKLDKQTEKIYELKGKEAFDYNEPNPLVEWEYSRPTISMARNWVFREYGIWMTTSANTIDWYLNSPPSHILEFESSFYKKGLMSTIVFKSDNPHDCESECLTEILKHLKNKSND